MVIKANVPNHNAKPALYAGEYFRAERGMSFDNLKFPRIELAGFIDYLLRDFELADVVQERGHADLPCGGGSEAAPERKQFRKPRNRPVLVYAAYNLTPL